MASKKIKQHLPLNRIDKFFNESEFDLEIQMGREWLEGDLNTIVVLFRIDLNKTITDDLYGESKTKHYHTPVELRVRIDSMEEGELETRDNGVSARESQIKMSFSVFMAELEEKNCEVSRGDMIGYNDGIKGMRYFEIFNADNRNISLNKTILGYKSYWRRISCILIDSDVFNG